MDRINLPSKPACWKWEIPLVVFEMANEVRGFKDAVNCLIAWNPRCSICNQRTETVPDHDHQTKLLRGMLCLSCNGREAHHFGVFELYRKIPPAMILDIHVRYQYSSDRRRRWNRISRNSYTDQ